jgi:hypothetical protein
MEAVLTSSRYYRSIFLEGLRKTTKNLRIANLLAEIRTEPLTFQSNYFRNLYSVHGIRKSVNPMTLAPNAYKGLVPLLLHANLRAPSYWWG